MSTIVIVASCFVIFIAGVVVGRAWALRDIDRAELRAWLDAQ